MGSNAKQEGDDDDSSTDSDGMTGDEPQDYRSIVEAFNTADGNQKMTGIAQGQVYLFAARECIRHRSVTTKGSGVCLMACALPRALD